MPHILEEPDAPVPQLQEEIVEVIQLFPKECISVRIVEQIVVFPRPGKSRQFTAPRLPSVWRTPNSLGGTGGRNG